MQEETKLKLARFSEPKFVVAVILVLAVTAIAIVSILRERIVSSQQNQVSIAGQGKISYQPDIATVTLGVQIDRAATADSALQQLSEKVAKIVTSLDSLGIKKEDVQTQAYTLNPQYDYKDNVSTVAGYGANQKLTIKVPDIINKPEVVGQVVAQAGSTQANQVQGVEFTVSNVNDLKQQARLLAIADAKTKSVGLAQATGVKLGKVLNWYDNVLQAPDLTSLNNFGYGGSDVAMAKSATPPQVPAGTQDIIVEVGLTYEVK
jgi:uncharacterized protein